MSFIGLRQLSSPLFYIGARMGALLAAGFLIGLAWYTVPLTPHVDPSFFFGNEDLQLLPSTLFFLPTVGSLWAKRRKKG